MIFDGLFGPAKRARLQALDRTQAIAEFSPEGVLLLANDRFCAAMGYRREEIVGQHHRIFIAPEEAASEAYRLFWQELRAGTYQAAAFRRLGKGGREVWLQATYNPIRGVTGTTRRILKCATDITEDRQRSIATAAQINAIDRSHLVITFAPDGTILDANANYLAAMGYTLDEIRGSHHRILLDKAEAESAAYEAFWEKLRAGEFYTTECRRIAKDGREVWLNITYTPMFGAPGGGASSGDGRIVGIASDVTRAKLENIFLSSLDKVTCSFRVAADRTIVHANRNFLELTGHSLDALLGHDAGVFILPASLPAWNDDTMWQELSTGHGSSALYDCKSKDGQKLKLRLTIMPLEDATGDLFRLVEVTNVTEDFLLQEKVNLLSLVADESDTSVVITDGEGRIEYCNPGFMALTGYSFDEVVGRKPGDFLQGPRTDLATVLRIREQLGFGGGFRGDILNYSKAGDAYWISLAISPVYSPDGTVQHFVSVQTDVTPTKQDAVAADLRLNAIDRSNIVLEWDAQRALVRINDLALTTFALASLETAQALPALGFAAIFDETARRRLEAGESVMLDFTFSVAGPGAGPGAGKGTGNGTAGDDVFLSATAQPLRDFDGRVTCVVVYALDVSARRRAMRDTEQVMRSVLDEVSQIAKGITTLSGQTNMLALNATIEAARAGEAGRGFAVVAAEVKALAKRSASSSGQISQLINDTQRKIAAMVAG